MTKAPCKEIDKKILDFINNYKDLFFLIDEDMRVIHANKEACVFFGLKDDDLGKIDWLSFTHPSDKDKIKNFMLKTQKDLPFKRHESSGRIIGREKKPRLYDISSTYDPDQKIYFTRAIERRDVSQELFDENKKISTIGFIQYNIDTEELIWDKQTYNIYEINQTSEVSLKRMEQFFRKDSLKIFKKAFTELRDHATPLDIELDFVSGKFKPSTGRFSGSRKTDDDGENIYISIQDLTDIKHITRKTEDYQEALDKSSIVSTTDRYGVITQVNDKFCEISKFSRNEIIGKTYDVINSNYHGQELWKEMWDEINKGNVWNGQIKNKDKEGSFFWLDTTIVPFKNSIGRIYQYMSIQRNITENKKLNEELVVSEKLSSIGEISAQILHEVMTPLSIISLSIENLEDDLEDLKIDDSQSRAVNTNLNEIKANYERIEEIFQNMRSILVQKNDGKSSMISIKETLDKTLSLVNAKLKSKDIAINTSKINIDHKVFSTESDLSQVFLNLVNNTCDAIAVLSEKWIDVSSQIQDNHILIRFQDSGKGIPTDVRDKIFDSLFTTKGESTGTGLGMGVCRKLVEKHNGVLFIDADSPNTTFVMKFPYKPQ